MTDFAALGLRVLGDGWQSRLARGLGVSPQQVRKWVSGQHAPPRYAVVALEMISEIKRLDGRVPEGFAPRPPGAPSRTGTRATSPRA